MKHLTPINRKANRIESATGADATAAKDVVALQQGGPPQQPEPHIPHGCSLVFAPGWEADRNGGTAGLCQPVERDLFDCHMGCFWPAQVPDQLNHAPDWTAKCAAAQKDWRKIDLIFPDDEKRK
ncbi:MAG TPA: quinohemoprotein amine dehydrogenase subunit gamma [Vicinamibacterales bacterium]|nr:quinohemoprotein amine dehydrogenase subunit gamma [Vicinamibacterales bacterium]